MTESEVLERLKEIAEFETTDDWSKGFSVSLLQQVEKGYRLSERQLQVAGRIIQENSPESRQQMLEWATRYEEEYKEDALKIASYYQHTDYYSTTVAHILSGRTPHYRAFMKMYGNKYAQRVLEEIQRPPRFTTNSYVIANSKVKTGWAFAVQMFEPSGGFNYNNQVKADLQRFIEKGAVIIEISNELKSACKGAKRYLVLPIGSMTTYWTEERYLKNKPKVKKK